jgi:hypothetical protein
VSVGFPVSVLRNTPLTSDLSASEPSTTGGLAASATKRDSAAWRLTASGTAGAPGATPPLTTVVASVTPCAIGPTLSVSDCSAAFVGTAIATAVPVVEAANVVVLVKDAPATAVAAALGTGPAVLPPAHAATATVRPHKSRPNAGRIETFKRASFLKKRRPVRTHTRALLGVYRLAANIP